MSFIILHFDLLQNFCQLLSAGAFQCHGVASLVEDAGVLSVGIELGLQVVLDKLGRLLLLLFGNGRGGQGGNALEGEVRLECRFCDNENSAYRCY